MKARNSVGANSVFVRQGLKKRPSPLRSRRVFGMTALAVFFIGVISSVFIRVVQVRYGQEIQKRRTELAVLRSEVRDLRSRKTNLTSYSNIENLAREMGMVFPRNAPELLKVRVPKGAVPPTWRDQPVPIGLSVREKATQRDSLLAFGKGTGSR